MKLTRSTIRKIILTTFFAICIAFCVGYIVQTVLKYNAIDVNTTEIFHNNLFGKNIIYSRLIVRIVALIGLIFAFLQMGIIVNVNKIKHRYPFDFVLLYLAFSLAGAIIIFISYKMERYGMRWTYLASIYTLIMVVSLGALIYEIIHYFKMIDEASYIELPLLDSETIETCEELNK